MALFHISKRLFGSFVSKPLCQSSFQKNNYLVHRTEAVRDFKIVTTHRNEELPSEVSVKDASKDRSQQISVETSIRYLKSAAYKTTYGEEPVWKQYRRNHKGALPPKKTRKTCIRHGKIATGNPCPICRDEYLVLHPQNTELLKQFISPYTGEILSYSKTGVCQRKHKELLLSIEVAKDQGLITHDVPFRDYDYSLYKRISGL